MCWARKAATGAPLAEAGFSVEVVAMPVELEVADLNEEGTEQNGPQIPDSHTTSRSAVNVVDTTTPYNSSAG